MGGRIPRHIVSEVLDRTNIREVVEDYVRLQKDGANHKGLCPFHQEKTPSFKVHEGKGIFKCFGCGESGNAISFLMKLESMSFREAVELLAGRAGITIPYEEPTAEEAEKTAEKEKVFAANLAAAKFYRERLRSEEGEAARSYLAGRGLSEDTLRRYGLGYAPGGWHALGEALAGQGFKEDVLHSAGLIIQGDRGFYDRFRDRLIFPILDVQGRIRGFGGRIMKDDPDQPKYLNSPETPVFKKGSGFFGIFQAKDDIRKSGRVVVVEGYMDQIALDRAGIPYSVAALGTAFTKDQGYALKRYDAQVFVVFDADEAGRRASYRALEVFLDLGISPRIVVVPDGKDPDDFLKSHPVEDFKNLLDTSPSLLDHYVKSVLREAGSVPSEKAKGVSEASRMINLVRDPIERSLHLEELSRLSGVDISALTARVRRPQTREEAAKEQPVFPASSLSPAEMDLIRLMIHHPETSEKLRDSGVFDYLSTTEISQFVRWIIEQAVEGDPDPTIFLHKISDRGLSEFITRVILEDDPFNEALEKSMEDVIHHITHAHLMSRIKELKEKMENAARSGNRDLWKSLLAEQQDLETEQRRISAGKGSR